MDGRGDIPSVEQRRALARPSYRERLNRRWPFVVVPVLVMTVVDVLVSGRTGWALLTNLASGLYTATIASLLLTLLVALVPGRLRPLPRLQGDGSGH